MPNPLITITLDDDGLVTVSCRTCGELAGFHMYSLKWPEEDWYEATLTEFEKHGPGKCEDAYPNDIEGVCRWQ